MDTTLLADLASSRDFAARYVTTLCTSAHGLSADAAGEAPLPATQALAMLVNTAPPMPGGEYLNAEVLAGLWSQIDAAFRSELAQARITLQEFLRAGNRAGLWRSRQPGGGLPVGGAADDYRSCAGRHS
ncbi:MAG: hypothetical protein IT480_14270 [Gammaproteobacteria bacterium]|nr:hypothetical protein [Gammaproteobacteria bacterium]